MSPLTEVPNLCLVFFRSLEKALNIKLHFTSGYHTEGDRQMERINQTLEQYLQIYCNFQQDNWHFLLPITEFCYNNTPSSTTEVLPFFANKGYNPVFTIHSKYKLASLKAQELVTFKHPKNAISNPWTRIASLLQNSRLETKLL
jgi:hypothetical protein